MGVKSKGQVFVIAAVILSSLILLTVLSYQQIVLTESDTDYRYYFQNALNQQSVVLDRQLEESYSVDEIRNELYSFNSFVDARTRERQVDYSAFQFVLLPEKQTALMINYRQQSTSYEFYDGSWDNDSVDSMQWKTLNVPKDRIQYRLNVSELDMGESFSASNPTLLGFIEMDAQTERWRNYVLR